MVPVPAELFLSVNLLPLFYPIFTCVDPNPYWEYVSGSTKLLNTDPIRIRIHNTATRYCRYTVTLSSSVCRASSVCLLESTSLPPDMAGPLRVEGAGLWTVQFWRDPDQTLKLKPDPDSTKDSTVRNNKISIIEMKHINKFVKSLP